MRVLYNGIPLLPPRTGVGRYAANLARWLMELDPEIECHFAYPFVVRRGLGRDNGPASGGPSFSWRLAFQRLIFTPGLAPLYPVLMDGLFRRQVRGGRYDLYHETNYVPRPFPGPTLVTIYDLSLANHPETHPAARVYLFRRDFARRIPRVDRFLAISATVRDELIGEFRVEPDRVTVTPLGVDPALFHPRLDVATDAEVRTRGSDAGAHWPRRYLLFVGSVEPRKNLPVLLEAYAGLPRDLRDAHPLVLVGPAGWKSEPVWRRVRALKLEAHVLRRGFLDELALARAYRAATAFVYPSLYEGFGLPPLEAMACGTPVICSDIPALREVLGDAALRLPPGDVAAWTAELRRILEDAELRASLHEAGLRRAAGYTWRRCAEATLRSYRELID
ncbi:MAG: glycosyltransferase family 4 protein [Gemmatimonadota bacterium]